MAALRQSDSHFSKLSESYHTLNRALHRAETDVEPTSDEHMTADARKNGWRSRMKSFGYLKEHGASA